MSARLRKFLQDAYEFRSAAFKTQQQTKEILIQIDDQDDGDNLNEICTIFAIVKKKNIFEIEICGPIPITREIADLVEIYNGTTDQRTSRIVLVLTIFQVDVLLDLSAKLRNACMVPDTGGNPIVPRIAGRTISSLHRFVRIIKEYIRIRDSLLQ